MSGDDPRVSPFESIRQTNEHGVDYWSARDLAPLLGYTEWRNFTNAIKKAIEACENSGNAASDHFVGINKMIALGKGGQRNVKDYHLSRYACYLVIQNADPEKEIVALGQTYFAVQTRRQELADQLAAMSEDERRVYLRDEMASRNIDLAAAASEAGVVSGRDFAIFQDSGYSGLYGGEGARDIAARKGLKPGQRILDFMGSEELGANIFRATQTEAKLRREQITGKAAANQTHFEVGQKVRQTIAELGGTMPEALPTPAASVQQVRRDAQKRLEAERQPSLFAADDAPSE